MAGSGLIAPPLATFLRVGHTTTYTAAKPPSAARMPMVDKVIAEPPMGARPRTGSSHHLHPHRRSLDHEPSMRRLAYCTPVLDRLVVEGSTTPAWWASRWRARCAARSSP